MHVSRRPVARHQHQHATSFGSYRRIAFTPRLHHRQFAAWSPAAASDGSTAFDGLASSTHSLSASDSSSDRPTSSSSLSPAADTSSSTENQVSLASSQETPRSEASASAEATTSSSASGGLLPDDDVEQLWNSVTRALLSVGKAGFQRSHVASLKELVASHSLVKVQLNSRLAEGVSIEADVAAPAGAVFLKRKGKTLLFASGGLGAEQLLAVATSNVERKQRVAEKRAAARQVTKKDRTPATGSASAPAGSSPEQELVLPPLPDEGSQLVLNRALQRVGKGPLDRSALLQEHEQVLRQLDADEPLPPPPAGQQQKRQRPWQQKKRGAAPAGQRR